MERYCCRLLVNLVVRESEAFHSDIHYYYVHKCMDVSVNLLHLSISYWVLLIWWMSSLNECTLLRSLRTRDVQKCVLSPTPTVFRTNTLGNLVTRFIFIRVLVSVEASCSINERPALGVCPLPTPRRSSWRNAQDPRTRRRGPTNFLWTKAKWNRTNTRNHNLCLA